MKNIQFSEQEIRAIEAYLDTNPCSSSCVYSEMSHSKKDCDDCPLTKNRDSIIEKLGL